MKRYKYVVLLSSMAALMLGGCGSSKIVVPSYSPPKEYKKLSEIESGGDIREGTYLALAINPDIEGDGGRDKSKIDSVLIQRIKEGLTETNFITIYPIYDTAEVALNMKVLAYEYQQTSNDIKADMQVSFTITKGVSEYLSKIYSANVNRHASNPKFLPSKNKVIVDLGKDVTKKFISDITPLKTRQLREFKPMPSELKYIITYAKRGNYESAIEDMLEYEGAKSMAFYYNFAVLYEALGSKTGDPKTFNSAKKMYRKSMRMGGADDDVVVNAKARFDNFYRLFEMTERQKKSNKKLSNELDDMYGQTE